MLPASVLERWLGGDRVAVVAPGLDVSCLSQEGRRVLVVAPDDVSALVLGVSAGAPLILGSTGTRERNKALSGSSSLLVTSVDALRLPSIASLLGGALASALRVSWGGAFLPGPALVVHAKETPGVEHVVQETGAVRVANDLALELVGVGGGVLLGTTPRDSLGGLPVRAHDLRRALGRQWVLTEAVLRRPERGIDAVAGSVALGTGASSRCLAVSGGNVISPPGAVVVVGPRTERPAPSAADLEAARAAARSGEDEVGRWVILPTGPATDALAATGAIESARPAWRTARVADAHRFRRPFVDAQPAWRDLAERYAAALSGWSLADRTRLALSDAAPRDLLALAEALGVRPSRMGDVLLDLAASDVVAARLEHEVIEAVPGPHWETPSEDLCAALSDAASGTDWRAAEGCRTAAWRTSAGLEPGADCGLCDRCDPSGAAVAGSFTPAPVPTGLAPSAPSRPAPGKASLDALFSGLGGASTPAGRPVRPGAEQISQELGELEGEPLAERVVELGGVAAALVQALFRHRGPQRDATPGRGEAELMLQALASAEVSWLPLPTAVSMPRPGTWTVDLDAGRWTFARRRGAERALDSLLARLVPIEAPEEGALSRLAAVRSTGRDLDAAVQGWESALVAAMDAGPGVPRDDSGEARVREAWTKLQAAAGQAPPVPELLQVVDGETESFARDWLSREGGGTAGRLAVRMRLASGEGRLSATELLRWWQRDRAALPDDLLGVVLNSVSSARRADIASLRVGLGEPFLPQLIGLGVRLGALPRELVADAIAVAEDAETVARTLVSGAPDARRARRLWAEHAASLQVDDVELATALGALDGPVAAALAEGARAVGEERARRAEARQRVLQLAEAGRLGEAAEELAGLPEEELAADLAERLADVGRRALERQKELVAPVAAVLAGATGEDAEDAGFGALEDAVAEGFGRALVALLSRQHRRAPGDPVRALWLARALCLAGEWAEGERVYGVAAGLRSDPTSRVATEFEGIFMAFEDGEAKRALRWLERALSVPWHQVLAPQVESLVAEGVVPPDRRLDLADLLDRTGSPFYGKLIRRLRG